MKVQLYTQQCGKPGWTRTLEPFARVPIPGEYVLLATGAAWHQVLAVVHTPFSGDCDALVYTAPVDPAETARRLLRPVADSIRPVDIGTRSSI